MGAKFCRVGCKGRETARPFPAGPSTLPLPHLRRRAPRRRRRRRGQLGHDLPGGRRSLANGEPPLRRGPHLLFSAFSSQKFNSLASSSTLAGVRLLPPERATSRSALLVVQPTSHLQLLEVQIRWDLSLLATSWRRLAVSILFYTVICFCFDWHTVGSICI